MSNFVIGDTHGSYDKVMKALELAKFSDSDILYFTGDLCDRGNQNKEVVDFFMSLNDRFRGCFGNHDVWLYSWLTDQLSLDARETWVYNGGEYTLRGFPTMRSRKEWIDEDYRNKFTEFVGNLKYIQSVNSNIRVMHTLTPDDTFESSENKFYDLSLKDALASGFIDPVFDTVVFDRKVLYSSKDSNSYMRISEGAQSKVFNKNNPLTIIGHTPLKEVLYCRDLNTLCIDTGGFASIGRISVVDLDTFICYDSDGGIKDLDLQKEN